MTTLLTLTDWLYALNPWQKTAFACSLLFPFWGALYIFALALAQGGYPGDRLKRDDEEDGE